MVQNELKFREHCHFASFKGQVPGYKTSSGAEAGHICRVLAPCQFIKLLVSCTGSLQIIYYSCYCLCPWIGRQHVNASYNGWWMAPACQALTLWVFSNFIICPFLYSLQPSTYDKVAFIPNDMGWAGIPKNHSAFMRSEILWKKAFFYSLPSPIWNKARSQTKNICCCKNRKKTINSLSKMSVKWNLWWLVSVAFR